MLRNYLMVGSWVLDFFSCDQVSSSSLNLYTWSLSHSQPRVESTEIMIGTRNTSSPEPDWNTNPPPAQVKNVFFEGHLVFTGLMIYHVDDVHETLKVKGQLPKSSDLGIRSTIICRMSMER